MSLLRASLTLSRRQFASRLFSTSSRCLVASNFGMPAMSPTMTEGGIVDWKFKEGDSFSAGDILLEIETDKAQIDVEAQDDGILAKVYVTAGATGIPVGKTIAVLAEPGDDLASLEIPAPVEGSGSAKAPEPKEESKPKEEPKPKAESIQKEAPSKASESSGSDSGLSVKANPNQTLLPSVLSLAAENKLSKEKVIESISASGPNGRILKGDILAYLGKVPQKSVEELTSSIKKREHLDLSNIVVKSVDSSKSESSASGTKDGKTSEKSSEKATKATPPPKPEPVVLNGLFTVADISAFQGQLEASLGSPVSLKSLIDKASKLALSEAYSRKSHKKSVLYDSVFEDIIAPNTTGQLPFIVTLKYPEPSAPVIKTLQPKSDDFYDLLVPKASKSAAVSTSELLKVNVTLNGKYPGADAKAKVYLDRLGYYLAQGKSQLVL